MKQNAIFILTKGPFLEKFLFFWVGGPKIYVLLRGPSNFSFGIFNFG